MTSKELSYKAAYIFRTQGGLALARRLLMKIVRVFFDTNAAYWFERDLRHPIPRVDATLPVEIMMLGRAPIVEWLRQHPCPGLFNRREIEVAEKHCHYLPYASLNKKIVAYVKIGVRRVYIDDYKRVVALRKESAFIYDTYVEPSCRNRAVAQAMLAESMRFLKAMGIKTVGCHIPAWNVSSINAYRKMGFRKTSYVRYVRLLSIVPLYFRRKCSD